VKVDTVCVQGFPVPVILAQAKELGALYIVLGSHGHTAFYDLVVGGTARGVLRRAGCPVVVVPAQPAPGVARK
jgi:nucleotide-binding universal stress UspA family protein